jgi:hypothetical protein
MSFISESLAGRPWRVDLPVPDGNRFRGTWLAAVPTPLPMEYIHGIDYVKAEFEGGYWS